MSDAKTVQAAGVFDFPTRLRHEQWNGLAAFPAINLKVLIEGEYRRARI
jgi:hypothetical protein